MDWFSFVCGAATGWSLAWLLVVIAGGIDRHIGGTGK